MLRLGLTRCAKCLQSSTVLRLTNCQQVPQSLSVIPVTQSIRNTSFFVKLSGEELWKAATTVSNAGKKRGRGKGTDRRGRKNLNKGQIVGVGKSNIYWPGLTGPVLQGPEVVQQKQLPPDPEFEKKILALREETGRKKRQKLHPLERGWSGNKMGGRKIGPPDPVGEEKFEDFDTVVLEFKVVAHMTANLGKKRRFSAFVFTGNKKGLGGFALIKALDGLAAVKSAKNRAVQRLMHFKICEGHTVYHDFVCQFHHTKIYVEKRPKGYGLVCHRAIKSICEILGIKDLYAKIEGSTGVQYVTKAFLIGLLQQKTYQEMADEKGLHLIELRNERENFPVKVASPAKCMSPEEAKKDPLLDFNQYLYGGKVIQEKRKYVPFYEKLPSWRRHLKKSLYRRNFPEVKRNLLVEYGELRSFLGENYPECNWGRRRKPAKEAEEAAG